MSPVIREQHDGFPLIATPDGRMLVVAEATPWLATAGDKAIINPGSVGQPRDLDPRASYAILTDEGVEFFRLEYDIDSVVQKIHGISQLSDWLGERLKEGR